MRALTVTPLTAAWARLEEFPEPESSEGDVLVEAVAVGVDGTDLEIVEGAYGWAPPGQDRLVLAHESLGRVLETPAGSRIDAGDLVVAFVRHPDPVPCESCAAGEWDMCRNGRYTEHGIKERHGFIRDRYRVTSERLVRADASVGDLAVLIEPTSVVAKAWTRSSASPHGGRSGSGGPWSPGRGRSGCSRPCPASRGGWGALSWTGWPRGPNRPLPGG